MLGFLMVPCHDEATTRFFWSQVSLHGLSKSSVANTLLACRQEPCSCGGGHTGP